MKCNLVKSTLIFCVIGLVIPGFSAILLLGTQMLFTKIGIECSYAWRLIWLITWVGMIGLPILFANYLKKLDKDYQTLKNKLILFNLLEYIFIQASLASLFTSGNTLCYVSDGQNGLELVFTAWLALPILIIFSFIFKGILEQKENY